MAEKADKIVRATVTGDLPVFINGVLHMPGEDAYANLDDLGVSSLDEKHDGKSLTPGLTAHAASKAEKVVDAPIAAVAPHAPDAPNPQGMAPGTVQSGTGRLIQPATFDGEPAHSPVGATKPVKGK